PLERDQAPARVGRTDAGRRADRARGEGGAGGGDPAQVPAGAAFGGGGAGDGPRGDRRGREQHRRGDGPDRAADQGPIRGPGGESDRAGGARAGVRSRLAEVVVGYLDP